MKNKLGKSGFTLLELLTVISIMIILASIVMPALSRARERAFQTKIKAQIAGLELALSLYESDVGNFPGTDSAINMNEKGYGNVRADWFLASTTNPPGWQGPYMEFKANETDGTYVLDAWGNPFKYCCPGKIRIQSFDIYSIGANGVDEYGDEDDINNWE